MRTILSLLLLIGFSQAAFSQRIITKDATDQTVYIRIIDSADGTPETSVAYNTSGIDLEYVREGATAVDITEATQTTNGAHTDGGFVAVGHGVYRLDLPDAAVATGVDCVVIQGTVPDMIVIGETIQLTAADLQTAISAVPTNFSSMDIDGTGRVLLQPDQSQVTDLPGVTLAADQSAVTALGGITITGARMPSDVTYWAGSAVATPATAGYPAVTVKIGSGTGEFDLNGGYVKVVSFVDGAIEAADFAPGAIDAAAIAADAIGASEIAANAIGASEMASGAIVYGTELTGTVNASVLQWNGTNVGTPDAAGYPAVTIKQGSGTGEMDINGGYVKVVSFVDGAIEAADFAPGAIDAAAIAADAIGASEIASNAIGAAEIANAAIDADTFSATGGFGPLGIIDQGVAQSATSTTLVLRSAAAFADDELIDASIVITGGSTGVGQVAKITDYVGSTDTATVDTWTTTPTGTITYQVIPSAGGDPTNWSAVQTQITTIEGDTGTDIPDLISAVDDKIDTIGGNVDDIETAADAILVDTGTTIPGILGTPDGASIAADIAAVGTANTVTADRVAKQATFFVGSEGNSSRNIVTLNAWSSGTRTLGYDLTELLEQADTNLNTVTSVTVEGNASITTSNLRKHQNGKVALWDTAAISEANAGTYLVTVTVTTLDSNTIVLTGTLEVE